MKKIIGIAIIIAAVVGISILLLKQKVGNVMPAILPPAPNIISNVTNNINEKIGEKVEIPFKLAQRSGVS